MAPDSTSWAPVLIKGKAGRVNGPAVSSPAQAPAIREGARSCPKRTTPGTAGKVNAVMAAQLCPRGGHRRPDTAECRLPPRPLPARVRPLARLPGGIARRVTPTLTLTVEGVLNASSATPKEQPLARRSRGSRHEDGCTCGTEARHRARPLAAGNLMLARSASGHLVGEGFLWASSTWPVPGRRAADRSALRPAALSGAEGPPAAGISRPLAPRPAADVASSQLRQ